jgi:ATP-dependent helicase/nuclease subunit B
MKCITLPYGNAGWNGKIRILEKIISSRPGPPFLYNDVLILVPSSRMKRMYGKLFLDTLQRLYGSASIVQPDIQTLHQLLQTCYSRLSGPMLMDENSRLVLLEGIVKERIGGGTLFNQNPDLLAPSLSSAIAKMIEQLSAAGVNPDDLAVKLKGTELSDKPQVHLLADVYTQYENALHESDLTDPAGMRAYIRDHFDRAWLAHYRTIVIDGIQDIGKHEADILRRVSACGNCIYLVDTPSPEILKRAGEFHPLKIAKDFLGQIGILPQEEDVAADAEQMFLASALFSDKTFSEAAKKAPHPASFTKKISLLSAVNTREEVTLIADEVKKSLKDGTPANLILVAFPALDEYGPIVEEIFTDYGIPYNRALGRQLSTSAVSTAMISLLHACQEDFSGPSLLRVFSSPFLKFSENPAIASALDRLMRDRRISGGKEKLLSALKFYEPDAKDIDVLRERLNDLFSALEPFSVQGNLPLNVWMERLSNLMAWSGLGARVSLVKGPLNINLQAYKKLNETLDSLAHAGKLFPGFQHTFSEWLFLVKKTFMHTRFQVPPDDEGGVQVLGLEESLAHPWKEIYLGGLVDGDFPQRLPQNIFLPEQTLETMGVRTLERARLNAAYHFYRLLLSADKVTLIYPENEGDRPVVPSPFLEELTPLKKAGLLNRDIERTSGIQFSLKIEDCRSIPELAKSISLAGNIKGINEILSSNIEGLSGIKSAVGHKPAEPMTSITPHMKREFWVTELEAYIHCPYDYLITNVLGIEPLEEVTEDISPLDRGSKVHAILRNFYLSWNNAITRENRDEAKALLGKLADSAFDSEADTFRNRRDKKLFLTVMAERFLDAEEEVWKQGMKPAYLEQKIEHYRLVLSNGEEVELSAKIDRIDVDENGNFIIVDYKTGKYPLPKMNIEQDIFQLPVYAVMAQQALSGKDPAFRKPIGLAYYDLKGTTGGGARDLVLYNKEARNDHPSSKPKASPKRAVEFEEILKQSMNKARRAIEGILAGNFTSTPQDESQCRYCPNDMMCEKESLS